MRILIVTDVSLFMRGGVPAEVRCLLGGLSARGHTLALLSHMALDEFEGVAHFLISLPIRDRLKKELEKAMQDFRPDVVHVVSMNSRGVQLLARILHAHRWVLTVHSLSPYERKLERFHSGEYLTFNIDAKLCAEGISCSKCVSKVVRNTSGCCEITNNGTQDVTLIYKICLTS